jgi:uncharacterized cupin superfamily protein
MHIQKLASTITLSNSELEDWGKVGLPLSEPPCQLRGKKIEIPGQPDTDTGVWECSPGQFRRQIEAAEMMHVLSGECTFTPDTGPAIAIAAGDTLFLPRNTTGVWDVKSTLRKVYALL